MKAKSVIRSSCPLLMLLLVSAFPSARADTPSENLLKIRIATGTVGGAYHELGINLTEQLAGATFEFEHISTAGTLENLDRLADNTADIAIIQNDIGHYVSSGKYGFQTFDEFSALIPLFVEQIQIIVRRDSSLRILGDLRQKTVALGPRGSGIHRNALDLLRRIGLRPNVDFRAAYVDSASAFRDLLGGSVDAVFYTGAGLPIKAGDGDQLRSLPLSTDLIAEISASQPYYTVGENVASSAVEVDGESSLFVTAYLIVGDHVPDDVVVELMSVLIESWTLLTDRESSYRLIPVGDSLLKKPFAYHPRATEAYVQRGLLEDNRDDFYILMIVPTLFLLIWWAHRESSAYDRLGNVSIRSAGWYGWLMLKISALSNFLYGLISLILVVLVLVYSVRYFETQYAINLNIDNEFANIGFKEALLWMFLFMGGGQTGDMFPLSTTGKILVTLIPVIGLGTLLGSFLLYFESKRKARAARQRGTVTKRLRNHVVICGWNEKVPGIIYALTSSDAPEKKHVVVVAELDGDAPLEQYAFDSKYVSYCRGNSIDRSRLRQASVGFADVAFVVAGYRKRKNQNIESVLTVMALKELSKAPAGAGKSGLYVAAELIHDSNREKFEICNVDALVHGTTLVDRMLAQSSFGRYILDYVLDMLTYDDFDEIHSLHVKHLGRIPFRRVAREGDLFQGVKHFLPLMLHKLLGRYDPGLLVGKSIDAAKRALSRKGINLLGVVNEGRHHKAFIDHTFAKGSPYKLWLTDPDHEIGDTDVLIYSAADRHDIYPALLDLDGDSSSDLPSRGDYSIAAMPRRKIAIVGNSSRSNAIRKQFDGISDYVDLSMFSTNGSQSEEGWQESSPSGSGCESKELDDLDVASVDAILITNDLASSATSIMDDDLRAIDAETLFVSRKICAALTREGKKTAQDRPALVAQMIGRHNRQLFSDAGINVAIPKSLLVERTLAKLAHSKGDVANLLLALLAFDDRIHLRAFKVTPACHSALLGKTYHEMMFGLPPNVQLLGWLPGGGRPEFRNELKDFEWHFITSPDEGQNQQYRCEVDDVLIVIFDNRGPLN